MKEQARDTMIRDKFNAGQRQCTLHRQLDGFAQDTPIGEIVDSCRVWESHSALDRVSTVNCDSDVGNQPGDSRNRERRKLVVNVQPKVVDTERQEPRVGNKEDPRVLEVLVNQLLQSTQGEILRRDRLPAAGPVCFSCGDGGHRINRCPQVNADFPFLPMGWSRNMDNGQYRATRINEPEISGGAGKRAAVQAGWSASRTSGDQSSTDPGGGFRRNKQRKSHWRTPGGNSRHL